MPKCCGGATCACKIDPGLGITISGSGTTQDPFVISSERELEVIDNTVFNLTVTGQGTVAFPWEISIEYAATAKLDDIPDVQAPSPTNGQVLGWDNSLLRWTPRAPTTAASGSVLHDTTLAGDGSVGAPLSVVTPGAGYLTSAGGAGVRLSDAGILQLVRVFADETERDSDPLVPTVNSLTMLENDAGVIRYWDGVSWKIVPGIVEDLRIGGSFLEISGAYDGGSMQTRVVKQLSLNTDPTGQFDVLDPTDLGTASGVIGVALQETGAVPYTAVLFGNVDRVSGFAYSIIDGTPLASAAIAGIVTALIY